MSCLFNSYDPYFKQPFGALRAGQTVRLTLCIPEELGYVDPHLVLQKEGKYDVPVHYRMKFDGQTPQQNHFSVELPQAASMLASSAVLSAAQANFFIILSLSYIGAAILPRP